MRWPRIPRRAPEAPGSDATTGDDRVPAWVALAYLVATAVAVWLAPPVSTTPASLLLICFFAAFQFLLMRLSVPADALGADGRGFISLDRLAVVGGVLVLGPSAGAWAASISALIWTLTSDPRREASSARAVRSIGNGCMFLLAALAAGAAYQAAGGPLPLHRLGLADFGRACLLILILQAVNELLFLPMAWKGMSSSERRRPFDLRSAANELLIGLNGIIAALAFTGFPWLGFALYVVFIIVVAMLFKYVVGIAKRARERAQEYAAVNRVNQTVNSAVSLDELLDVIFREAGGLMDFAAFLIAIYDREHDELDVRLNYDEGVRRSPERRKPGEGLLAWTLQNNKPVFIQNRNTSTHEVLRVSITRGRKPISIIAMPINFGDEIIGVLSVQDYRPYAFRERDLRVLESFAAQVAVAIVNTRLFAELKGNQQELESRVKRRTAELELTTTSLEETMRQKEILVARLQEESRHDALTGLANRRHLDAALEQELQRALRFQHPLALAMGDLDFFKQINDAHGHVLGDEVLYRVADILRQGVRATDLVARYGGEEFVLLLPETDQSQAALVCEKLREQIEAAPWNELDPHLPVTMSFGIAAVAEQVQTASGLLAAADRALYAAKRGGRNRVCQSPGEASATG
ncbi:MAG TPA: diguanylate cyclase [Gammaproteobacteria bacterium]|nr:diguanylate cyclase [Gammaproteobacteria bacterium]